MRKQFPTAKELFKLRLLLAAGTLMIMIIVFAHIFYINYQQMDPLAKYQEGSLTSKDKEQKSKAKLLQADEALHARLLQLQNLDQQFASLLNVENKTGLDTIHQLIQKSEKTFKIAVDSVERIGLDYYDMNGTNDFQNIITFFKAILENRRLLSYLRSGLVSEDNELLTDQKALINLQMQLLEKDKLIASLENKKVAGGEKANPGVGKELEEKNKIIVNLEAQAQKDQAEKQTYIQNVQNLTNELNEKNKLLAARGNKSVPADQKLSPGLQQEVVEKNKKIRMLESQLQQEVRDKQLYVKTVSTLRADLAEKDKLIAVGGNRKLPADQKSLSILQNEISQKDSRIRSLEDQLRRAQSGGNTVKAAKGETLVDLQQRNNNLRLAYNNTMTQLGTVTKKYNSLRSEMEQLRNQR